MEASNIQAHMLFISQETLGQNIIFINSKNPRDLPNHIEITNMDSNTKLYKLVFATY